MLPLHSTKSWVGVLAITLFVLGCGTHEQPSSAAGGQSNVSGGAANGGVSMAGGRAGAGSSQSGAANAGAGGSGNTAGDSAGAGASGAAGSGGNAGAAGNAPSLSGNTYDGERASTLSFDSDWKFHLGDVSGAQASAFDDGSWAPLDVPHDWSISLPFTQSSLAGAGGGYLDGGVGWYRKSFALPAVTSEQKLLVQFDGVYMDSTVWLNGTQICQRPYGYSSFECDMTASAKQGAMNVLAVRVNNQLPSSRWYSGSGIYRRVWLKVVNAVRVAYSGVHVTTPKISASEATVNVAVTVQNDAATDQVVQITSSVRDAAGLEVGSASATEKSIAASKSGDFTASVSVGNPKLWSISTPSTYSLVTTVTAAGAVVDTYTTSFGIRSFAFDASNGFSLNGQAMKINGVCLHHDLGSLGAAVNYRAIEKRLQLLKDMGANAIRTSHNPPAPELLDLADRLGFLVMDEAFDMWYAAKTEHDYARFFRTWADRDIADMVARDRNHPSIIIWSIGNEIAQAADQAVVKQLMAAIKTKDDTRVIGQAFAAYAYDDGSAALEDVVGINYAPERYDSVHQAHPTWKMFASETSSAFRSRGIYDSKDTQTSSYDDSVSGWGASAEASWTSVNSRPWIAGEFIWTGVDYIGEPTPYEWPAKSSYFGAIDTANFPKDIFYFYQSKWGAAGPTMVHIVPMDWTTWTA
ncbi:MAG TPA: glycoside hydrolase family 2 TIM barrel-domain containing protein, partial [Polyangiaceae bacterium]|nr:glycoside hydrolase family 2 TIM barrel-domain containing protein [Polyangiaceae bacterium]